MKFHDFSWGQETLYKISQYDFLKSVKLLELIIQNPLFCCLQTLIMGESVMNRLFRILSSKSVSKNIYSEKSAQIRLHRDFYF